MLQQNEPDDFVIATGETHTVREFCEVAFGLLNLDYKKYVTHHERYERPAEVDILIGDATKARTRLGWKPTYTFRSLIESMVKKDYEEALVEKAVKGNKL